MLTRQRSGVEDYSPYEGSGMYFVWIVCISRAEECSFLAAFRLLYFARSIILFLIFLGLLKLSANITTGG